MNVYRRSEKTSQKRKIVRYNKMTGFNQKSLNTIGFMDETRVDFKKAITKQIIRDKKIKNEKYK